MSQQVLSYLVYPFSACMPSTSAHAHHDERQGLLADNTYEDSDAISLLSNIADRSRRRNRAARRREQWNKRAAVLGCGLFGRPKGQIQRRTVTSGDGVRSQAAPGQHGRSASVDSAASLTDDESVGRAGSFGAVQESGDEDAGMLGDEDIAELSHSREEEEQGQGQQSTEAPARTEEDSATVRAEEAAAAAQRKEELERQAAEAAQAEQEAAAKQKAEEDALAAEEEAAIAKARRRAERKAVKQGLLQVRAQAHREGRRLTEAEAEAAAGGFDFAEEPEQMPLDVSPVAEADEHEDRYGEAYRHGLDQYGQASDAERYGYYEDAPVQPAQQEVVHHHYYYNDSQQDELRERPEPTAYQAFMPPIPQIAEHTDISEQAVEDEDEEDADIAGLAFSKNRKKRLEKDGSYASRSNGSGSGSRQSGSANHVRRYERNGLDAGPGSNSSTGWRESAMAEGGSSNGGGSGGGVRSYRDQPRRHERTGSRSTGSGAGRALREGPVGKIVTSPTIPEADSSRDMSGSTVVPSEDRADAAAGGFDDYLSPPLSSGASPSAPWGSDWRQDGAAGLPPFSNAEQDRRASFTPPSSSSARAGRRREGPRKGFNGGGGGGAVGLNAPRNPQAGNIFTARDDVDEADGL